MFASLFIYILLIFHLKEEIAMLVRLYASEIIMEKITIDDVPKKLKPKVSIPERDWIRILICIRLLLFRGRVIFPFFII